ncbi:MAG: EAL domain-containing protein [Erythrobacter sp.]|jgi:diguanylate cyclase (GGDEF)-like protein/PAS domain S-box-containing protein|nr:EAL domain-containing protein [Erythrobacter sp.]
MGNSAIRTYADEGERTAGGGVPRAIGASLQGPASPPGDKPVTDAKVNVDQPLAGVGAHERGALRAPAEPGERRAVRERRAGERDSAEAEPSLHREYRTALPRRQDGLALFLVIAFVTAGGIAQALPPMGALIAMGLSLAVLLANPLLAGLERREEAGDFTHYAVMVLGVIVPQAAAGYAIASWVGAGLAWQWAVATMVCLNAASATLLGSRIISLFTGKISAWAAFALVHPSPLTLTAIMGAALALTLITRFQWLAAERKRLASEARERVAARAEDILRSFEETGQGWFWETDRRGLINYISPSAARVLGQGADALRGLPLASIIDQRAGGGEAQRTLGFHLSARSAIHEMEVRANTADGEERWWSLTGRPVYDSYQNFCGFRGHGTDLTEKRRSEQQVTRLAHYDSLTGLANRLQMGAALDQMLAAPREVDRACAVFMLDLDRFKQVNDTLGHPAGDALLKQVAQRLERVIGARGRCGRLGGDEFQVIIPGLCQLDDLAQLAQTIIAALSQPYSIDGNNVVIGVSIGVAVAPVDGTTSEALIRNVDLALYAAKDAGRGVHRFYAPDLHSAAEERAELEQDLREALSRGDLELHYQPVVSVASEKIVGFEALMRWHHARRGWIAPEKFIAIAEDTGLIDQLGQWAIRTACADLARWPEAIRCAVNVSPLQFSNPDLPAILANALAHAGVSPARFELEITESVFINDSQGTDAMIRALKRVGVRLALDDFGTGYSSLGYLKKAPFDRIKIDQSFMRGPAEDRVRNSAIISSITSLADALNMETTAEGVETLDELEMIRVLGCSHVQGFVYHPPMRAEAAGELVSNSLAAQPDSAGSTREPRQVLLRRVTIAYDGNRVTANIRNLSEGGAMIEGLWHMVAGQVIEIEFTPGNSVAAEVRWARENRVGVAFPMPLSRRSDGGFTVLRGKPKSLALARR